MPKHTQTPRDPLGVFHPAVQDWFRASFAEPTLPQQLGWPPVSRGESTLILAPTGTGKTLAAFLWCINRLMFEPRPEKRRRCRILYISPLKALAVDVERNLRAPIAGISRTADLTGTPFVLPAVSIRTGDTPSSERRRFQREPSDILITTPESIYLLLTSNAREVLRAVDTVIVDEIHALVPSKRGAHLALSIERLEALTRKPLQRIGLSATQRPLDEVARFLGGAIVESGKSGPATRKDEGARDAGVGIDVEDGTRIPSPEPLLYRPVTIIDAGQRKPLELSIEVPVEDMARLGDIIDIPSGPASQPPVRNSIWTAIHPKLLKLVQEHHSTLIFVNSRRLAERLAGALNELAGSTLVRAHHGSLALPQRREVEDRLKSGALRGLVATSSLELGIDMAAVDLVVQIEAPPSVSSGLQRIGRGSHQVGATSRGVIFPKYRGDLVACAAATRAMLDGLVEATRYPRNPLDVLAQQIVAMAAMEAWAVDDLFAVVRSAASYATLSRQTFEGVLDMLAGRYPSDDFAELRPRLTWDRVKNVITAREGARYVAVINGGTIPDRGLYGVFLAGADGAQSMPSRSSRSSMPSKPSGRVGELDEEMVFESRTGDTFVLGASTWRVEEITNDRVLVSPAPGEPGKMPFWKGDKAGRPLEFGRHIGALVRKLREMPASAAIDRLIREHGLDRSAAENLLRYLNDQAAATQAVPDDRTIIVERCRDELGDWRVCVLTHFGGRIHAPWAMAATVKVRESTGAEVETLWTDDGFVVRFPDTDEPPDTSLLLPQPREVEDLVVRQLGSSALFAAKFREAAARALLLPRRRAGGRTPLWQQRKRAADLLSVAAQFSSFPMVLEAYRECLHDVFDMPALVETLAQIRDRGIHVATVDTTTPSPFASSLLFGYVANYIYDGDAPLAERRAQALAVDQTQLRELLGDIDLRELLDANALDEIESELQALAEGRRARNADGLHDLLLRIGDLSEEEILRRSAADEAETRRWIKDLTKARRILRVPLAGSRRFIAVEDAARLRDALGIPLPPGLPEAFLESVSDPLGDLLRRYARTHGPFSTSEAARRFGVGSGQVGSHLKRLAGAGKLLEGEFRPHGHGPEWCDADVLRAVRRRSLAKLRHQAEPVDPQSLARLVTTWQGVVRPRRGLDALLDAVESLQGAPLPASVLESEILPARLEEYNPADVDTLMAAGEVVWCGVEPLGDRDGRVALYLADHLQELWEPRPMPDQVGGADAAPGLSERALKISGFLRRNGASFFAPIHAAAGGGYPGDSGDALWDLVWRGLVTNDSFGALRAFAGKRHRRDSNAEHRERATGRPLGFRSRRRASPSTQGRWSLVEQRLTATKSSTERRAALAQQLLNRYGILTREAAAAENVSFGAIYPVLKMLEESGRIRRGFFVSGIAATQFAMPAAVEMLRSLRAEPEEPEITTLAATDPANPYGALLKWPSPEGSDGAAAAVSPAVETTNRAPASPRTSLSRSVGARVVLVNGALAAYLRGGNPSLSVFLPEEEPQRSQVARAVSAALRTLAVQGLEAALWHHHSGLLIGEINGVPAPSHPLAPYLEEAGFTVGALGYHLRRVSAVGRQ